jgi:hypothetical protein|tara:strand:- start:7550 stop:7999 length:450 start_codon:yes stop_codon:yes gene_type:complete
MAMLTIANVQEYQSDILEYGLAEFDDFFAKTETDIQRRLEIDWWQRRNHSIHDITIRSGDNAVMDTTKLKESQFTRAAVYHCLAFYILPRLTTWTPERDRFREMIDWYTDKWEQEFDLILKQGVYYDEDGDSVYESDERTSYHHGRLVR